MNTFFNNVKNFFVSVFNRDEEVVIAPQNEDEYDRMLGV